MTLERCAQVRVHVLPGGGAELVIGTLRVQLNAAQVHELRAELSVGHVVVDNQTGVDLVWSLLPQDVRRPGLPRGRSWVLCCRIPDPLASGPGAKVLPMVGTKRRKRTRKQGDES